MILAFDGNCSGEASMCQPLVVLQSSLRIVSLAATDELAVASVDVLMGPQCIAPFEPF